MSLRAGNHGTSDYVAPATRGRQMQAYDSLPPAVQKALQDAMADWAAWPYDEMRFFMSEQAMIEDIRRCDRNYVADGQRAGIWNVRIDKEALQNSVLAIRNMRRRKNKQDRR